MRWFQRRLSTGMRPKAQGRNKPSMNCLLMVPAHIATRDIQRRFAGKWGITQHTFRVRTRLHNVQQPPIADIINV